MNEIINAATFYYKDKCDCEKKVNEFLKIYESKLYDFNSKESKIITQNNKKRWVYYYEKDTFENIMCSHFSFVLSKKFAIKYNDRTKIIKELINCLQLIKNMNDFTIIRFDFKNYFNSMSSAYIYEKYIQNADISRDLLNIMQDFFKANRKCSAGLPTSNILAELISKEFDLKLKANLLKYGVVYYERYVDDGLIILNSFIDINQFNEIINCTIREVFYNQLYTIKNQNVKLNNKKTKIINKRLFNTNCNEKIIFLGYEIILNFVNGKINFKFGISEEKRKKYQNKFNLIIEDYKKNKEMELLRQRILLFSRRVVYSDSNINKNITWLSKGVVSNYNELRHFDSILEDGTKKFLKKCIEIGFKKYNVPLPYFMKNNSGFAYNLYNNLMSNKSIIFDEKIGMSKEDLIRYCKKIGLSVKPHANYEEILYQYLNKIKNTTKNATSL